MWRALALALYCGRLVDEIRPTGRRRKPRRRTGCWTSSPGGQELAVAVVPGSQQPGHPGHGGYGYTREYDVEQHYRDNRLNPIHEGTHGIQAWTCWDAKSLPMAAPTGGAGLAVGATIAAAGAAGGEAAELAAQLDNSWQRLTAVTASMFASGDVDAALANSVVYLEAFGHIVIAWIWLEQLLAADGRTGDFYDGKRQAARYFFRYEAARTAPQLDLLASLDRTTLEMRDGWF